MREPDVRVQGKKFPCCFETSGWVAFLLCVCRWLKGLLHRRRLGTEEKEKKKRKKIRKRKTRWPDNIRWKTLLGSWIITVKYKLSRQNIASLDLKVSIFNSCTDCMCLRGSLYTDWERWLVKKKKKKALLHPFAWVMTMERTNSRLMQGAWLKQEKEKAPNPNLPFFVPGLNPGHYDHQTWVYVCFVYNMC